MSEGYAKFLTLLLAASVAFGILILVGVSCLLGYLGLTALNSAPGPQQPFHELQATMLRIESIEKAAAESADRNQATLLEHLKVIEQQTGKRTGAGQ